MSPLAHSKGEGIVDGFGTSRGRNRRSRAFVGASSP
jgi:hypothetical protein